MTEAQLAALKDKKALQQLKINVRQQVRHYIEFYWLDFFETMLELGMQYHIAYLHCTTEEELPHFQQAITDLQHPLLKPEMVKVGERTLMNRIFDDYPSTSHFKYVIDLPVFEEYGYEAGDMFRKAKEILQIENGPVYFLSNGTYPLIQLELGELIQHGNELFDSRAETLIFTDPGYNWIIFRNIEDEWRCGWTKAKSFK